MINGKRLCLVIAFLCFLIAAFGIGVPWNINLVALGLALWVGTSVF